MYTIDMSNKHKRNFVLFVELVDGHKIIVCFDTVSKAENYIQQNEYIEECFLYDRAGKEIDL